MKNLTALTFTFVLTLFFISCSDKSESTNDELVENNLALAGEGENGSIEYLTLEELNQFYASKGMKTTTLEDLGATEEEYIAGQKRFNNPDKIHTRWCTAYYAVTFLDYDNNTVFNYLDVYYAEQAILGITNPGVEGQLFGMATIWWFPFNYPHLSTWDAVVGKRILLGLEPCM